MLAVPVELQEGLPAGDKVAEEDIRVEQDIVVGTPAVESLAESVDIVPVDNLVVDTLAVAAPEYKVVQDNLVADIPVGGQVGIVPVDNLVADTPAVELVDIALEDKEPQVAPAFAGVVEELQAVKEQRQ